MLWALVLVGGCVDGAEDRGGVLAGEEDATDAGWAGDVDMGLSEGAALVGIDVPSRGLPGYRVLGEFEAEVDPSTGIASVTMLDALEKSRAIPGMDTGLRSNEDDVEVEGRVRFLQDSSGNGQTPEDCRDFWTDGWSDHGDTWRFWVPTPGQPQFLVDLDGDVGESRFCTNFRLINDVGRDLSEIWIIVDGITIPGARAWVQGAPRVTPSQVEGDPDTPLEPSSLQGMFRYGTFLEGQEVTGQWYFYLGGAALGDFRVRGRIIEVFREECGNGLDNNGDGIEDSGCFKFHAGAACSMNQDCVSGACDGGVPIDPQSPGSGELGSCEPSDEGGDCLLDSDCTSGLVCDGANPGEWIAGTCEAPPSGSPIGSACFLDADCVSDFCDPFLGSCRQMLGGSCTSASDCPFTNECDLGFCAEGPAFVSTWQPANESTGSSGANQVRLPLDAAGNYDFLVDWGDGSQDRVTAHGQAEATHTYAEAGERTITIRGQIEGWRFDNTGDRLKLLNISSWGPLRLGNETNYFFGAENLTISATDVLDLTGTTNLTQMFRGCSSITTIPSINDWDVSEVTNMQFIFLGANSFNQDLDEWDVSKVVSFGSAFWGATAFNGDVTTWELSSATDTANMFSGASSFNRDIGGWDMEGVTTTVGMFNGATSFNQDLPDWNVSSVTVMQSMFNGATVFNGDISSWTVSDVTNMRQMFNGAHAFDRDIGGWNVSKVQDMSEMFQNARAFNQDIGGWDVGDVTTMGSKFNGAWEFDQDIGGWDVSSVVDLEFMFSGILALTTANYDALLIGWASLPSLQPNRTFHAVGRQYSPAAAAARQTLIDTWGWTINDGGPAPDTLGQVCTTDGDCLTGQWCPPDGESACAPVVEVAGNPMRFNIIPAASQSFTIGSPVGEPGRVTNEAQATITFTRSFAMQNTMTTRAQWAEVVADYNAMTSSSYGTAPSFSQSENTCSADDCPVESVNWYEAVLFANMLSTLEGLDTCYTLNSCTTAGTANPGAGCGGSTACTADTFDCASVTFTGLDCNGYRLPTEAEWEFAARAGTTTATYNGDLTDTTCPGSIVLDSIAWYACNSETGSVPYLRESQRVGLKTANAFGLFDMLGNVEEWSWNWYSGSQSTGTDPTGPGTGTYRIPRGGRYTGDASFARAARRYGAEPEQRINYRGFRLVRTTP